MHWHLSSFAVIEVVSHHLISHLLECESPVNKGGLLSVLGEDHVGVIEAGNRAHNRCFLPKARHIETDTCLSLGLSEHTVRLIDLDHGREHFNELFLGRGIQVLLNIVVFVGDLAILIIHPETLELLLVCSKLQLVRELVTELQRLVYFVHGAEEAGGDRTGDGKGGC